MSNELERGITVEKEGNYTNPWQLCIRLESLSPNTTSLVELMGKRIINKFEDLISRKIGKLHTQCNLRKSTDIAFNS